MAGCCAFAFNGHATDAPPTSAMKSRRLMRQPSGPRTASYHTVDTARPVFCALQQEQMPDFGFGSLADIRRARVDVRSTPRSGHQSHAPSCLLWATSGLLHQSAGPYSNTLSARASMAAGISISRDFAVLRLIIS